MDFILTFLNKFLTNVSVETLNKFKSLVVEKKHKKNEIIVSKGEIPYKFYILRDGVIGSIVIEDKGKEFIKTLYTPITTTGDLPSLIQQTPSNTIYQCLTDCTLIEGDFNDFIKITEQDHTFALLYCRILEMIFIRTEKKMNTLAVLNASERYIKLKKEIPNIENLIPQYHIASYLNITPVQLSRIRKEINSK